MSKNKSKVEILNPLPGGMRFTSPARAQSFVEAGDAEMKAGQLCFFEREREKRLAEQEPRRGETIWWNGSSRNPAAMYRPGKRRS